MVIKPDFVVANQRVVCRPQLSRIAGGYRAGKCQGQGIYYDSNGPLLDQAIWEDGEFVRTGGNEITEHRRDRNRSALRNTSRPSSESQVVSSETGFFTITDGHIVPNQHVYYECQDLKVHFRAKTILQRLLAAIPQTTFRCCRYPTFQISWKTSSRSVWQRWENRSWMHTYSR